MKHLQEPEARNQCLETPMLQENIYNMLEPQQPMHLEAQDVRHNIHDLQVVQERLEDNMHEEQVHGAQKDQNNELHLNERGLHGFRGINPDYELHQSLALSGDTEECMGRQLQDASEHRLRLTDTRYPQTLPTEESPRRRARSLPVNSIPEASEKEEAGLLCCCKLKKRVQFADSLGLTLASIKHFMSSDEPTVPSAVLARLQSYPPTVCEPKAEQVFNTLVPGDLPERLLTVGVCLEQVSTSLRGVRGSVLVQDPKDGAQVKIRYTFNEWLSFLDCPASAIEHTALEASLPTSGAKRFQFTLCYPPTTPRIHFAIWCSNGHGQEMWDNNRGNNYTVRCQQELHSDFKALDAEQESWETSLHW
ncbi:protein phosphatase 1 regulatory subunit 3G [Pelodytes ibericus]